MDLWPKDAKFETYPFETYYPGGVKPGDLQLIDRIALRAAELRQQHGVLENHIMVYWALMHGQELRTVHHYIVPLRLKDMAGADDADLAHDVFGIHRHLLRGPKPKLSGCFMPRFADLRADDEAALADDGAVARSIFHALGAWFTSRFPPGQ
jgi:hypothetical protein